MTPLYSQLNTCRSYLFLSVCGSGKLLLQCVSQVYTCVITTRAQSCIHHVHCALHYFQEANALQATPTLAVLEVLQTFSQKNGFRNTKWYPSIGLLLCMLYTYILLPCVIKSITPTILTLRKYYIQDTVLHGEGRIQNFWNCFFPPFAFWTLSTLNLTVLLSGRHCPTITKSPSSTSL